MTSGTKMQQLADKTTAEGLLFVRARKFVHALWNVGEMYHAGQIDYAEFGRRNTGLWNEIVDQGLRTEVNRQLRNAR